MDASAIALRFAGPVSAPAPPAPRRNATDALQQALSIVQRLKSLGVAGREYAVSRDSSTRTFVIAVRDRETRALVGYLKPEEALRLSEELADSASTPSAK
jgi:hypothetical protein